MVHDDRTGGSARVDDDMDDEESLPDLQKRCQVNEHVTCPPTGPPLTFLLVLFFIPFSVGSG